MIRPATLAFAGAAACLAAGALAQLRPAQPPAARPVAVRNAMIEAVNPPALAIWNLQVEAMDEEGAFDPALMDEARWASLARQADALELAARDLAEARAYVAAVPPFARDAQGIDLAAIQQRLDAEPAAFSAMAQALARHAADLQTAITARDPARTTELVNDLQPVCKACHNVFWYPDLYE